jgi:transmembrane sensor
MPESNQPNITATQAAYWRAQLSSDLVTDQHRREFEIWLSERPENKAAWLEINAFWSGLDNLTEADVTGAKNSRVITVKTPGTIRPNFRFARPALAIAASLLLLVSIAYTQTGFYFADYTTAPGKQRNLILADGSTILMNTDTAISVNYSAQQQHIILHDGEAYFAVAADAKRPFQVQTDYGSVRALGTAFNIKIREQQETVTVYQHAVKVTTEHGEVLETLSEGQAVVFTETAIDPVKTGTLQRARAWRDQRMIFQDRSLAEVIAELNRYRSGRIIIMNNAIKKLPVTGVFDTVDTNVALKTIEQSLPINVTKITEKLVLLTAK